MMRTKKPADGKGVVGATRRSDNRLSQAPDATVMNPVNGGFLWQLVFMAYVPSITPKTVRVPWGEYPIFNPLIERPAFPTGKKPAGTKEPSGCQGTYARRNCRRASNQCCWSLPVSWPQESQIS